MGPSIPVLTCCSKDTSASSTRVLRPFAPIVLVTTYPSFTMVVVDGYVAGTADNLLDERIVSSDALEVELSSQLVGFGGDRHGERGGLVVRKGSMRLL